MLFLSVRRRVSRQASFLCGDKRRVRHRLAHEIWHKCHAGRVGHDDAPAGVVGIEISQLIAAVLHGRAQIVTNAEVYGEAGKWTPRILGEGRVVGGKRIYIRRRQDVAGEVRESEQGSRRRRVQ